MNKYQRLFNQAIEKNKRALTAEQVLKIQKLYLNTAKQLKKQLRNKKTNKITRNWINSYLKSIKTYLDDLNKQLNQLSLKSLEDSAKEIARIKKEVLKFEIKNVPDKYLSACAGVPKSAIEALIKGTLYKDGKGLSERIWDLTKKYEKDIQTVLIEGMTQGKTYTELMDDLNKYINPKAKKDWKWSKVYPGTNRVVDYNAQRLMRTSINHAFFIGNIRSTQDDPFAAAIHWQLSSSHYERQILPFGPDECDDFATRDDYKLGAGNFPDNKVPTPHPNCLCTQYPVYDKSSTDIGKEINRWIKGEKNQKLDNWWENFTPADYYTV